MISAPPPVSSQHVSEAGSRLRLLHAAVRAETWHMDASLAPGRNPGSRGFSKSTGVALLLAAAGVSLAVGIADLRTSLKLADGAVTAARVAGKHVERSRNWTHRYMNIEYRTSAGQIIRARDDVSSALYDRVKVGDTITVRYLLAEPGVHALARTPSPDTFMLWLAGLWLVLSGVYWFFGT